MKNIIKIFLIFAIITSMASAVYYPYKSTFPLSADISMNNHKLTGLAAPTASNDAATKAYVDGSGGSGGDLIVTVGSDPKCDYVTDGTNDHVEWQQAIDYVHACGGGAVYGMTQIYYPAQMILIRENVHIIGPNYPISGRYVRDRSIATGCQFNIVHKSDSAFVMFNGAAIENCIFYYPNQYTNAAPDVYPATIRFHQNGTAPASDILIRQCLAVNPYHFINMNIAHQRLIVEDCCGFPLQYGINTSISFDIDYIQRNSWNAGYYEEAGSTLKNYVATHGCAYSVGDSDWPLFENNGCYGYKYGLYWWDNGDGIITANTFDGTQFAITITDNSFGTDVTDNIMNCIGGYGVQYAGTCGINVISGNDNRISDNEVVASVTGISVSTKGNSIVGNKIRYFNVAGADVGRGIYLKPGSSLCTVIGNSVDSSGIQTNLGIVIDYSTHGHIVNSNIIYNTGYGIYVANGATDFTCVGNSLNLCTSGIGDNSGSVNKEIAHNIIS